jgi:hypothetical protein
MINELTFPSGLRLLSEYQSGKAGAKARLKQIFDAAIAGECDANFATPAPDNAVNIGGSVNLLTLTIMHDLYGLDGVEFYKDDAERYVRATLFTRRLLGMNKLYISWPVYAFTCEAMGQKMMYPDKFPPGADPDEMLINRDTWRDMQTPDFDAGIPKIIRDIATCYTRLTGAEPILHLSAPYSLAADIYGQEPLLAALVHAPDFANDMLDLIVDRVLRPWIDHFVARFPNAWIELSDASGSPFFIGPDNCKNMAIRSIKRLVDENPWGHRVYDANYRGDYVTQAQRKVRSSRRKSRVGSAENISIEALTDLKHSVCRDFVIRLDDDRVPVSFYEKQAVTRNVPLFCGIGASQIDRNSIADTGAAMAQIGETAEQYVEAIKNVAVTIANAGYKNRAQPWPGTIYFEDISSEAQFDMIEVIVETALESGAI